MIVFKLIDSYEDSYFNLKMYCHQMKIILLEEEVDEENYFLRLFITYNGSLQGLQYCQLIIGIDNTYLKNIYYKIFIAPTTINIKR